MKKILTCLLLIICALIMFGCNEQAYEDPSVSKENKTELTELDDPDIPSVSLEEISDEDFFWLVDNLENNIYNSLYQLNGEDYGRVISSSDSAEDAVKVCTRHFTDTRPAPYTNNTVVECRVIYESDILYGIYVKWEVSGSYYDENVISFKSSVADITVRNVVYNDEEAYVIQTEQEEQIKQILLYLFYDKYSLSYITDYEMLTNDNECVMTLYSYYTVYGDWGMSNEYNLQKHTAVIDKTNGKVTFEEPVLLKTAYRFDN